MKNLKTYEQFINEGRSAYDGIASKLTSNIFQTWIKGWKFKQKRIPFIVRRPIPGGGCEYWNLKDMEIICF